MSSKPFQKPPSDVQQERTLRDYLAIDRTILANRRTLLAFVRTGIYFVFTGLVILNTPALEDFFVYSLPLFGIGVLVIGVGLWSYFRVKRRVSNSYQRPQKEK